ncbi:MAG: dihydrofolate reductase, partial [Chitinophagaceae bacterium]
ASTNNVIGNNDQLLWKLPKDMQLFKNKTWALPIVMGRKTFKSLGNKALNGRLNIVITRQSNIENIPKDVVILNNIEAAIAYCKKEDYKEIMIIGGGEIYAATMPLINTIYITRVHANFEGDTSYPTISTNDFSLAFNEDFSADEKHAYNYSFQTWVRK